MKEKILLFMTDFYSYYKELIKSIENQGYDVVWVDDKVNLNFFETITNKITKKIYHTKFDEYFNKKIDELKFNKFSKIIIIFGADSFKEKHIKILKDVFNNAPIIYYARDSVINFPNIENLIKLSDKAFSFDPYDAEKFGATFLPLFYCDNAKCDFTTKYDVSTIMSLYQEKIDDLKLILPTIPCSAITNINLIVRSKIQYIKLFFRNITFFIKYKKFIKCKSLSLKETNLILASSKVIIDCPIKNQKGLTIRTFETLSKNKKLVTTNSDIKNYDFYNANNICIIGEQNLTNDFLSSKFDESSSLSDAYEISNFTKILLKE